MPPFYKLPLRVLSPPYALLINLRAISTDSLEHSRPPGSESVSNHHRHRGAHRPNDQRTQNVSGKLPWQRQEPPRHHVPTNDQPVSCGHQALHREDGPGAIAAVLEPQEMVDKKSSTGLDVRSATMRHQEGIAGTSLGKSVKGRTTRHQEQLAGRSLAGGVQEGFAVKPAPAYGDAVGHAGNSGRREKLR